MQKGLCAFGVGSYRIKNNGIIEGSCGLTALAAGVYKKDHSVAAQSLMFLVWGCFKIAPRCISKTCLLEGNGGVRAHQG